jgi:deoxyribodipyrimidine photolyase-related protein
MPPIRDLIMVLGDQLDPGIASLAGADPARDAVFMCEVHEETSYVRHHKQKIAYVLSAMRHFAEELRTAGWRVDYLTLEDAAPASSFTSALAEAVERHRPERVVVTEPGEWRVREAMLGWERKLGLPVTILEDARFLCSHEQFGRWASGRKELRMEYFYREMRRRTGLLMEGDRPAGGRWNFDADNRRKASPDLFMPKRRRFPPDETSRAVIAMVEECFPDHFGSLERFGWPVTRADAQAALDHFVDVVLPFFGDYQDAMLSGEAFLYHSLLSPAINNGLLDPLAVCRRAERAWQEGRAPINAVEGFIRQIIGWREYVRGVYWLKMPDYAALNHFEAERPLPWFYWSGETDMACMRAVVGNTRDNAYAHHIERLMVTGNFAMLAGIDPRQVHDWYLSVYADAYEWVELPNVIGMSQFADGGLLGSKPYAASGAYIDRMSDHCGNCRYDVRRKTGDGACPFNALYWDFLARNEARLRGNHRLAQVYRNWDRMDASRRDEYRQSAARFLADLDADAAGT